MNVHPEAVARLVREGLAPAIADDPALRRLTLTVADELTRYGAEVLPREVFARTSGSEVAAMACEDVEGALFLAPLLAPRQRTVEVEVTEEVTDAAAGDGGENAAARTITRTEQRTEEFPPRVVELSEGFGMPGLVIAVLNPQLKVDVVESDLRRIWLLKRLTNLLRTRNVVVHHTEPPTFVAANPESADVVLVKRHGPQQAVELATPLLKPEGRLVSWQREDRSRELRRRIEDPRGRRVRLEQTYGFESAAARRRVLLCVGCDSDHADASGDGGPRPVGSST